MKKEWIESTDKEVEKIQTAVAYFYGTTIDKMKQRTRRRNVKEARYVIWYFIRKYYGYFSLGYMAKIFDLENHATVINGLSRVDEYIETEDSFRRHLKAIDRLILEEIRIEKFNDHVLVGSVELYHGDTIRIFNKSGMIDEGYYKFVVRENDYGIFKDEFIPFEEIRGYGWSLADNNMIKR